MIKQLFKSLLFVVLVVPGVVIAMEGEPDKIKQGRQLADAAYEAFYNRDWEKTEHLVEHLIKLGADLNQRDKDGETPLIVAVISRRTKIVEMLIDAGADLNLQTEYGETALTVAAVSCDISICHMLIDAILEQNKEQRSRICTFLLCLKQIPGFRNTNQARDLFKPILLPTIISLREEINRIIPKTIKNQLLEKYGLRPISNAEAQ